MRIPPVPTRRMARRLAPLLGTLTLLAASAEAWQSTKPDQVMAKNRRTGAVAPISGVVERDGLEEVVVVVGDRNRNVASNLVVRVVYGDVPPAYREGLLYFDRGDFENAAAKYQLAAEDASAREVVQADARLRGAQALMRVGAADLTAFGRAAAEAATFLADHPTNRQVPKARSLQARATHLSGDAAGAAGLYRLILREAETDTLAPGYTWFDSLQAGLRAADAFLEAADTAAAREAYAAVESGLNRALGALDPDSPERVRLAALQAEARLGEGMVLLAGGNASQALTFFRGQLASAGTDSAPALRFGARLGLGEALLATGEVREAQIELATVSAIDHTDRDRAARALVGLAKCALETPDGDARVNARLWLETVTGQYGDTPAVRAAHEMLQTL